MHYRLNHSSIFVISSSFGFCCFCADPWPSQQKTAQWDVTVLLANRAHCCFSYPIFHKYLDLLKFKMNRIKTLWSQAVLHYADLNSCTANLILHSHHPLVIALHASGVHSLQRMSVDAYADLILCHYNLLPYNCLNLSLHLQLHQRNTVKLKFFFV